MSVREDAMSFLKASMQSDGYIDSNLYYKYLALQHDDSNATKQKARYALRLFEKQFKDDYKFELEKLYIYKQVALNYFSKKTQSIAIKFKLQRNNCYYAPIDRKKISNKRSSLKKFVETKKKRHCSDIRHLIRFSDKKVRNKRIMFHVKQCNFVVKTCLRARVWVQKVQISKRDKIKSKQARLMRLIRSRKLSYSYDVDVKAFRQWKSYLKPRVDASKCYIMSNKMMHYLLMREAFAVCVVRCWATPKKEEFLRSIIDCYSLDTFLKVFKQLEDELFDDKNCILYYLKQYSSIIFTISKYIIEVMSSCNMKYIQVRDDSTYEWNDDITSDLMTRRIVVYDDCMTLERVDDMIDVKVAFDGEMMSIVRPERFDECSMIYPRCSGKSVNKLIVKDESDDDERLEESHALCFLRSTQIYRPQSKPSLKEVLMRSIPYLSQKEDINYYLLLLN